MHGTKNPGLREPKLFRAWLVRKLTETVWMHVGTADQSLEQTANQLGVRTDVLIDAFKLVRSNMDNSTRIAGLAPIKIRADGQRATLARPVTIHVVMPEELHQIWDLYLKPRGYSDAVLLRSLIHHGLLLQTQPTWLGRGWPYRGKLYHCKGFEEHRDHWPWQAITQISSGANAALIRRSRAARVSKTAFIRGLILDLFTGRIQSFDNVTEVSQMYEANRYVTREGALEARALKVQRKRKGKSS